MVKVLFTTQQRYLVGLVVSNVPQLPLTVGNKVTQVRGLGENPVGLYPQQIKMVGVHGCYDYHTGVTTRPNSTITLLIPLLGVLCNRDSISQVGCSNVCGFTYKTNRYTL